MNPLKRKKLHRAKLAQARAEVKTDAATLEFTPAVPAAPAVEVPVVVVEPVVELVTTDTLAQAEAPVEAVKNSFKKSKKTVETPE